MAGKVTWRMKADIDMVDKTPRPFEGLVHNHGSQHRQGTVRSPVRRLSTPPLANRHQSMRMPFADDPGSVRGVLYVDCLALAREGILCCQESLHMPDTLLVFLATYLACFIKNFPPPNQTDRTTLLDISRTNRMPQASPKISSALGIRLAGESPIFAYGDTIIGHVFRAAHIVATEAVVTVTLYGRTKTKIIAPISASGNTLTHRGRDTIIDEQDYIQTIFRGPLHIPSDPRPETVEQTWQFAIAIPPHVGACQTLPGTFTTDRPGFTSHDEAFVEFGVKAELHTTEHGTLRMITAVFPVTIRALSLDPPIADFELVRRRIYGGVSSNDMLPSVPSFLQRTKMRLNPSGKPTFAGHLEIDSPTIIQLEHPDPIPLRLRFIPDTEVIFGSGIQDIPQGLQIRSLTMEIHAFTEIGGDDTNGAQAMISLGPLFIRIWSLLALGPGTPLLYIPCDAEGPALDVGERADFRIGYHGLLRKGFSQGNIYPSFAAGNIKHKHHIEYRLQAKVSEEELDFRWGTNVNILPPSDLRELANMRTTHQVLSPGVRAEADDEAPPVYQE